MRFNEPFVFVLIKYSSVAAIFAVKINISNALYLFIANRKKNMDFVL